MPRNGWHGALHDLFSLAAFVGLGAAYFVYGRHFARRGERGWAIYSVVSGSVFVAAFVLSSAGFAQEDRRAPALCAASRSSLPPTGIIVFCSMMRWRKA